MGSPALLPTRRKVFCWFLSPLPGLNARLLGPVISTLTTTPPRRQPDTWNSALCASQNPLYFKFTWTCGFYFGVVRLPRVLRNFAVKSGGRVEVTLHTFFTRHCRGRLNSLPHCSRESLLNHWIASWVGPTVGSPDHQGVKRVHFEVIYLNLNLFTFHKF
jgi:hypothetical protein